MPTPSFGLPDTLTHGDFHPGNRQRTGKVVDWSDAVWGHPALEALDVAGRASHLHNAVKHQEFLDDVEESERICHEGDPANELRAARRPGR